MDEEESVKRSLSALKRWSLIFPKSFDVFTNESIYRQPKNHNLNIKSVLNVAMKRSWPYQSLTDEVACIFNSL